MELLNKDNVLLNHFSNLTFQINSSNRKHTSKKNSSNCLNSSSALLEEDTQKTNDYDDNEDDDDCYSDIDIPLHNKNECIQALKSSKNNSL